MKFLYIIDYWVPGYTGVINLIASTDNEAFDIISNKRIITETGEYHSEIKYHYEYTKEYEKNVCKNILNSQRFPLRPNVDNATKGFHSGIVYFVSFKNEQ